MIFCWKLNIVSVNVNGHNELYKGEKCFINFLEKMEILYCFRKCTLKPPPQIKLLEYSEWGNLYYTSAESKKKTVAIFIRNSIISVQETLSDPYKKYLVLKTYNSGEVSTFGCMCLKILYTMFFQKKAKVLEPLKD